MAIAFAIIGGVQLVDGARPPTRRKKTLTLLPPLHPPPLEDLGAAVDAKLVDQEPQERLGLWRVGFAEDVFEQLGRGGEGDGRGRACALVGRGQGAVSPANAPGRLNSSCGSGMIGPTVRSRIRGNIPRGDHGCASAGRVRSC
jgi:hypothetical protein